MRRGEDSASALVRKAGMDIGILLAETVFSGACQDQYGVAPAGGHSKWYRVPSEPTRPDPAFPAPSLPRQFS